MQPLEQTNCEGETFPASPTFSWSIRDSERSCSVMERKRGRVGKSKRGEVLQAPLLVSRDSNKDKTMPFPLPNFLGLLSVFKIE